MTQFKDSHLPLGRAVSHSRQYDPGHLFAISRQAAREEAGVDLSVYPFWGQDLWNVYELSWLSPAGKPRVAMAEIRIPADSPNLIESKSLKLYLNSLNMTPFEGHDAVQATLTEDLCQRVGAPVSVRLIGPQDFQKIQIHELPGLCIDHQPLESVPLRVSPNTLRTDGPRVTEKLFSRLFRSVCPVTAQPDWATIGIHYSGHRIDPRGLLTYLVSFREHAGFHESCVERIFCDLLGCCAPLELMVTARFTRRGGLDINPTRATADRIEIPGGRDPRQ